MIRYFAMLGFCGLLCAETPEQTSDSTRHTTASLDAAELVAFTDNPPAVRALLEQCLVLTRQNLDYKFGSADPAQGGMDCSGTIYYILLEAGIKDVPRSSSEQYVWARKADNFEAVVSRKKDSFELDALRPGDLLFWTGTYSTDRDPPVTHTMIYLGMRKSDGKQVMFGASDGRSYDGRKIWGVSVFDFTIAKAKPAPAAGESATPGSVFIGYANIPGLAQEPN
ncbi:MAG: NlpC/P60 family protein [Verrucomicrobiota bacterium]